MVHYPAEDSRWGAVQEKLEGHIFNNLRSIVFRGTPHAFADKVVGVLRRAPNILSLDLCCLIRPFRELPQPPGDPIPHLRLRNFRISWIHLSFET